MSASVDPRRPRVCVVQDGARLHYAVPIALQRHGALERVYTDWYAAGPVERLVTKVLAVLRPGRAKRMAERTAKELDAGRVISKPSLALQQFARHRYGSENDFYAMLRERTGRWIRRRGFGEATGLFGFVRNIDPAVCEAAKVKGLRVVVDQMIAPFEIEQQEAALQERRFPGWSVEPPLAQDTRLADVERRTWDAADRITCASAYVRDGLIRCGVGAEKIAVLPYPFDPTHVQPTDRRGRGGPVTVGFVGTVGLRKGVPYVLQLARRFDPAKVRFVLVGPAAIKADVLEQHRGAAKILGPVPRSAIAGWLERFDLFLLPSTCEGSAGAVVEAMAAGLPVVVSPNAGAPLTDGVEGCIASYDDVDAMERHVTALAADADRRHVMGQAARCRVVDFSLDAYGPQLTRLFAASDQQVTA